MAPPSDPDWQPLREAVPAAADWAYLDNAAVAPLCAPARDAICRWAEDVARRGDVGWSDWMQHVESTRRRAAQWLGADPAEIALVANTTAGINLVADAYPWQPGDNVVMVEGDFPTNRYPWMLLAQRGVEVRVVPAFDGDLNDPVALAQRCDGRTRIVAVSWVTYANGWRNDLDMLADLVHRRGALLCVDAIQGLGVLPLNVRDTPIDFLAADGHKWLLSAEGAGILYLRREHLDRLQPRNVGWQSAARPRRYDAPEMRLADSAARYEGGSLNVGGFLALGAALELLGRYGTARLAAGIDELRQQAVEKLHALGAAVASPDLPHRRTGIVRFELPGRDPAAVQRRCRAAGVVLSVRAGGLRISIHAYNDRSDIDRLADALRGSAAGEG